MLFAQAGGVRADQALAPLQGNIYSDTFTPTTKRYLIPDNWFGTRYITIAVYSSDAYIQFGRSDATPTGTLSATQAGPDPGTLQLLVNANTGWLLRKEVDYNFMLPPDKHFKLSLNDSDPRAPLKYFAVTGHQREPGGPANGVWEARMTHIEQ